MEFVLKLYFGIWVVVKTMPEYVFLLCNIMIKIMITIQITMIYKYDIFCIMPINITIKAEKPNVNVIL